MIDETKGTPELREAIRAGSICEIIGHHWARGCSSNAFVIGNLQYGDPNKSKQYRTCANCGRYEELQITEEWIKKIGNLK